MLPSVAPNAFNFENRTLPFYWCLNRAQMRYFNRALLNEVYQNYGKPINVKTMTKNKYTFIEKREPCFASFWKPISYGFCFLTKSAFPGLTLIKFCGF